MRIAFYAPMKSPDHPVPSGDRRVANLYRAALTLAAHEVTLASAFRSYDGAGATDRQAALRTAGEREAERLIHHWSGEAAHRRPAAWFTYHLYHKAPDWLGPAVADALHIPYLVAEPSFAPKRAGGPWAVGHAAAAAAIGRADALVCPTRLDMACVAPLTRPARLHYLPPFLDVAPFIAAAPQRDTCRAALAARHNLDPAVPWLLAVGMMRPGDKLASYRQLGAALSTLRERPWRLLVAGDGEARAEVGTALAPLGERVAWLSEQSWPALPALYAASDLYVWPAVDEAYGMALLEAQAAGLPVVAGRVRGVGDVVRGGVTGLLAAPDDTADFAAKVALLLRAPERRRALGQAAAHFVRTERSLAAAATRLDSILATLTQRGRAVAP